MKKTLFALTLISALSAGAAKRALAAPPRSGVVLAPGSLPPAARAQLAAAIERAKKESPQAFRAMAELRAQLADIDAHKRGKTAPLSPRLKAMGPQALLPMIEQLAFSAPPRGALPESAWSAFRAQLLEAVGMLRDPRSAPVLRAVLEGDEGEYAVVRAAAEALGRLGDDAAAQTLAALARAPGARQKPVLDALGDCRRIACVEALSTQLAARPDDDTKSLLLRSLGRAGSSWAWQTPAVARSGEEAQVRASASSALVSAFLALGPELREEAARGLLMVDDPAAPAQLAQARGQASPELAADIDRMLERLASNPLRAPSPAPPIPQTR